MNEHKKNGKTLIPDLLMDKWQHIVDLLANVLSVPSAIVTRIDLLEIAGNLRAKISSLADCPGN